MFETSVDMTRVYPSFESLTVRRSTCAKRYLQTKNREDISICTSSVVPALTICKDYQKPRCDNIVCGETEGQDSELEWLTLGINCADELLPASAIFEVTYRDGELHPVSHMRWCLTATGSTPSWTSRIRPARDRHEQNVEVSGTDVSPDEGRGRVTRCVTLRTLRSLQPGEELLAWYSDELARQCGVPILTPTNITADRWYICNACRRRFRFPNTLKAHILFHCHPLLTCLPPPISPSAICDFSQFPAVWPFTISPYGHNWKGQTPSPKFELYVKGNNGYTGIADHVGGHHGDCSATLEKIFSKAVYRNAYNSQQIRHSSNDLHRCITLPSMHPVSSTNARLVQMKHKSLQIRNDYNNLPASEEMDFNKAFRKQETNSTCKNDYPNSTSSYNCDIAKSTEKAWLQNDNKHLLTDVREARTFGDNHKHGLSLIHSVRGKRVQKSERKNKELKQEHSPSVAVVKTRSRHPCVFCGKMYSRRYGLTIHLRTHSGYKPLTCRVCARPFGDPSNLNKHIRLHATGETPYNCTHCGKVLVRRRDLERHIRSRHPNHLTALATVQPRLSSRSLCEAMIAS